MIKPTLNRAWAFFFVGVIRALACHRAEAHALAAFPGGITEGVAGELVDSILLAVFWFGDGVCRAFMEAYPALVAVKGGD